MSCRTAAFAQTLVPPSDPVAKGAFDVLDRHCARCHQEGRLIDRDKPAKNFGNILKLDEIAASPHYVLPGNALGSKLFRQIADREMPYDVNYEGDARYPHVTADDLQALERWIVSLGARAAAACGNRAVVTPAVTAEPDRGRSGADACCAPRERALPDADASRQHLHRRQCDEGLPAGRDQARQFAQPFGECGEGRDHRSRCIDPADQSAGYRLDAADWETVLSAYPYNVQPAGQASSAIAAATQTPIAAVRADWFAYAASQPPLYDDLMRLPNSLSELAREQGVNIEANIRNFVAQRAGFQRSGVSQNNRMIERHAVAQRLFLDPLRFCRQPRQPEPVRIPARPWAERISARRRRDHLQPAERLSGLLSELGHRGAHRQGADHDGARSRRARISAVTTGISCMGCHDQGLRKARDEVRDIVLSSRTLPRDVRDKVEALHPPHARMDALIETDMKRFADAMVRAGLDPALKLERRRAGQCAGETLRGRRRSCAGRGRTRHRQIADQVVSPRIRSSMHCCVGWSRGPCRAISSNCPTAIWRRPWPIRRSFASPLQRARERLPQASRTDELSLTSDADFYRPGDGPVFTIASTRDCYLTLTNVDEKGEGTVLLPNRFQQDNLIRAGSPIQFPGANAPFQYRTKDKGVESIVAVCTVRAERQ